MNLGPRRQLIGSLVVAVALLSVLPAAADAAAATTLKNGDFSKETASWAFLSFAPGSSGSVARVLGFGGVAQIVNPTINDSRCGSD